MERYTKIVGIITITAPAAKYPQGTLIEFAKAYNAGTASFMESGAGTKTEANTKSPHPAIKPNIAVTANAGRAKGNAINIKA
jgi:hypothetical protein